MKIIEKVIATQIHNHLINNYIVDNFQCVYKTGHSGDIALLREYNDIGKGNGDMHVLFDLSAAFDTIDHDNIFCIFEKYVGICGNALKRISHIVPIVLNVLRLIMFCHIKNILGGAPPGSVLRPLKFILYVLIIIIYIIIIM